MGQKSLRIAPSEPVNAKALQRAVVDLQRTRPGPGLRKTLLLAVLTLTPGYLALTTDSFALYIAASIATGIAMGAWLITTHDAIHHTLTGWRWLDEILPRLVSYPVIWVHGTYAEVHKLHHKMNADDVLDPERVQWTVAEYEAASPLGRFYARHQWFFSIFVFAGFGMIYKTIAQGARFLGRSKGMRRQMALDLVAIGSWLAFVISFAVSRGEFWRYLCFWLIIERITGGIMQWRALVEHYGLWGKGRHFFETQVYGCRNLATTRLASWYFNHLNFHSVHHTFPRVPFYHLEEAHRRFTALVAEANLEPLEQRHGYVATSWNLARAPRLIGEPDPLSPRRQRVMVTAT